MIDLLIDGLRAGACRAEALGGPALTFDDMRSMGDGRDTGPGTAAP